jgi:hypothetical protein
MITIKLAINADGSKIWCQNNKCHKDNQRPAIYLKGKKFWFENGGFLKKE